MYVDEAALILNLAYINVCQVSHYSKPGYCLYENCFSDKSILTLQSKQ